MAMLDTGAAEWRFHAKGEALRDCGEVGRRGLRVGWPLENRPGRTRPSTAGELGSTSVDEGRAMAVSPGDRVLAEAESTERAPRRGVVEEVVRDDPHPRYRIRWDDGHESIYTPADGALRPDESARSPA
jgi:hypothetical protein